MCDGLMSAQVSLRNESSQCCPCPKVRNLTQKPQFELTSIGTHNIRFVIDMPAYWEMKYDRYVILCLSLRVTDTCFQFCLFRTRESVRITHV